MKLPSIREVSSVLSIRLPFPKFFINRNLFIHQYYHQ
jgi:hypothetical protein